MKSFILPVDKPVGPTSHDIVSTARRALGERRIGHTGTLDPFASGLLLLCVGQATRLAEYLLHLPKTYRATARFDAATTTDDITGERIEAWESARAIAPASVRAALERQRGTIMQRPSSFSAKKISGERAYARARRGEAVDLALSNVTIYDMRVISMDLPDVEFEVRCSSGTYVRAIARDVGAELGTGGYLTQLRRTAIGPYDVDNAVPAGDLGDAGRVQAARIAPLQALPHMEHVTLTELEEAAIRFGQSVNRAAPAGTLVLVSGNEMIGIATSDGICIKPGKVFPRD